MPLGKEIVHWGRRIQVGLHSLLEDLVPHRAVGKKIVPGWAQDYKQPPPPPFEGPYTYARGKKIVPLEAEGHMHLHSHAQ